ncbi:MAG: BamA/TamA family outer membrane protein, partial [Desulfosarcinaceae bacterium]
RTLWRSRSQILAPAWHPGGERIVFSSDLNGVYNLYQVPASGGAPPVPVTHVWGGLLFPSFSADGRTLAAVGFDGDGGHLVLIPYTPDALAGRDLPVIQPRWPAGRLTAVKQEARARQDSFAPPAGSEAHRDYNSLTSIRPDFWSPWLMASTFGVQGGLAGVLSDPTQRQEIFLAAGAESEYGSPLATLAYTYRFNAAQATLFGGAGQDVYPDLLIQRDSRNRYDYAEETRFGGIALSVPVWRRMEQQMTANLGYTLTRRQVIEKAEEKYDGVALETTPAEDDESSVWGQLVYFSGTTFDRSVSVEDGALAAAGVDRSIDGLGGQIDATRLRLDVSQYLSMPYLENHVLKLSGTYAWGWGDRTAQGLFGLGGFGSTDLFQTPGVGRTLTLRGYEPNFLTGQEAVRTEVSYRFPIWNIFKGAESWFPVYARSLFAEVFYEGGRTWNDVTRDDDLDWINAAGVEVNFGTTLFRFLKFAPGLGVAYVPERNHFDEDKEDVVVYMAIKLWANF